MNPIDKPNQKTGEPGRLPANWRWSTLDEVAHINPPRTKPESDAAEVSFLAMGDVSEDGHIRTRQTRSYSVVAKGFTSFINKDVLVAKITPCFENGKGALVAGLLGGLGFGSTEFHVLRARPGLVSPEFLHLHTRTEAFRTLGEQRMVGSAGQKRVPVEFLRAYPVALPPQPEQQKIAAILNAVDDKLDVIARQIEATQTLKRGLMQTLFSRGVGTQDAHGRWVPHTNFKDSEVGEIPATWKVHSIESAFAVVERPVKMISSSLYRRVTVKRRYGGIELRDELAGADIKVKTQFLVQASDFLISERQIVHGACGIVPQQLTGSLVSNEYLVLTAREGMCVDFFNYMVQLVRFAKYFLLCSQGVDVEKFLFKPKDWLKKPIPIPPLAEQQRIAEIITQTQTKLTVFTRKQEKYQTLKRGLMQKLLTGQWRVQPDHAGTPPPVAEAA